MPNRDSAGRFVSGSGSGRRSGGGLSVDLGSLHARTAAAVVSLREEQPAEMFALLAAKAEEDRTGHEYQNRTGDAEAATQAGPLTSSGDVVWVDFGMDVDYAVYLDARGLTRVRDLAVEAENELGYYFDGERDRLAGL